MLHSISAGPPRSGRASALGRLLVAYDGSEGADAAASFALWLAGHAGSAATLLHVCDPGDGGVPAPAAGRLLDDEVTWRRRLENLRDYAAPGAAVAARVETGPPARAIVAAAASGRADLVLIGSRGRGRVRGALLGSVSARVLSHAPCSVMVFPDGGDPRPAARAGAVLAGVDGSRSSHHALAAAAEVSRALGAPLILVHVADPHVSSAGEPTRAVRDELRRHGGIVLHEARTALDVPPALVETELLEGRPGDELAAACARHAPALLVVGDRGLGGVRELLVGSTSRRVAGHTACPVLVARRPAHAG